MRHVRLRAIRSGSAAIAKRAIIPAHQCTLKAGAGFMLRSSSRLTFEMRKSSGVTSPPTTPSPSPQLALIATTLGSPVSGLHVNITPETSALTIACTATPIAGGCASVDPHPRPVGDRGGAVERDPAASDRFADAVGAAHPEVGLLLAGEGRLGGILAARRRAHRDRRLALLGGGCQRAVVALDLGRDRLRDRVRRIWSAISAQAASTAARSCGSSPRSLVSMRSPSPSSARNASNAAVETANPGGTGIPPAISSPRLALLPPKLSSSFARSSASVRDSCVTVREPRRRAA